MKHLYKYICLFAIGGTIYYLIELLYRGYSHWTMYLTGAICFTLIGLINELLSWKTPLWKQALIGGTIITTIEFIVGCIVNLLLKWNIWNYTRFDILGQVCLPFYFIWCMLSIIGIVIDDYLRYWLFNEEKPKYKLF
jgi:uncharacterized membrane protein